MGDFYKWKRVHTDEISAIGKSRRAKGIFFRKSRHKNHNMAAHAARLSGIALSGGGIRSATFNLGILQSLANLRILHTFDYLSTVSGGGYIGSWFSAWIFRTLQSVSDPAFTAEEFEKFNLNKLCRDIEKNFSRFSAKRAEKRTNEWLNEFLEKASPHEIISVGKRNGATYSRNIYRRLEALKGYRTLPEYSSHPPNAVKLLNRLILEKTYSGRLPSFRRAHKNAPAEAFNRVITDLKTSGHGKPADDKKNNTAPNDNKDKQQTDYKEAGPIRFLRKYSNYLTPRRGFSTDTLTLGVAYTINFAVNLIVLILILGAILTIPLLVVRGFHGIREYSLPDSLYISISAICLGLSLFCAFLAQRKNTGGKNIFYWIFAFVFLFLLNAAIFSITLSLTSLISYSFWKWALFTGGMFTILLIAGRCTTGTIKIIKKGDGSEIKEHCRALGGESLAALVSGLVSGPLFYFAASSMQEWSLKPGGLWHVAVWGYTLILLIFGVATIVYTGIAGQSQAEDEREWTFRLWALIARYTCSIGTLLIVGVYGPLILKAAEAHIGAYISSILTAGWLATTIGRVLTWKKGGQNRKKAKRITGVVAATAPYIFILGLVMVLSIGLHHLWMSTLVWLRDANPQLAYWDRLIWTLNSWYQMGQPPSYWDYFTQAPTYWDGLNLISYYWLIPLAGLLIFLGVAALFSWRVGVNEFSLHSLYGNRLVRAYLGASNPDDSYGPGQSRRDPFTFFNPSDNNVRLYFLSSLYDNDVIYPGPYPLINTTINLSKSKNLAWQKRKGASFVFSPRYSGFARYLPGDEALKQNGSSGSSSYVRTRAYSSKNGVSLGKAMTISGAAASPNMGYYTSKPLAFLMTIFNLRLGWWLGNPAKKKAKLLKSKGPKIGFRYLLTELLARTDDSSHYVYLSDGGHFENLGIYELVKRRCRYIVACDAGRDEDLEFNDLGNAIEKCRTDFGIDIHINVDQIRKQNETGASDWHCAVGQICYSAIDKYAQDGILLYIKASLTGDEPVDIVRYASQCPDFPHQSTADQWFDETQFESYRRLGEHIARFVFQDAVKNARVPRARGGRQAQSKKLPATNLESLFYELKKKWYPPIPAFEAAFSRHASGLEEIISRLKTDKNLRFLDRQMYPALSKLNKLFPIGKRLAGHLPKSGEEIRAGFYLCKEMLVFMESVYHDLNLDEQFDHPDNRGWINLFQRWAWSRMFRFTWSVTASTFGARFQTFCEQKMKFRKDQVKIGIDQEGTPPGLEIKASIIEKYKTLKTGGAQALKDYTSDNLKEFWKGAEETYGFNFFEVELLVSLIIEHWKPCKIFPIFLHSEDNPLQTGPGIDFNVGFIVTNRAEKKIHYFRIQNHLRQMGLARKSVYAFLCNDKFRANDVDLNLLQPSASAPEVPSTAYIQDFTDLFHTIKREVEARNMASCLEL